MQSGCSTALFPKFQHWKTALLVMLWIEIGTLHLMMKCCASPAEWANAALTLRLWDSPPTTMAFIQSYGEEWPVCEALMFPLCLHWPTRQMCSCSKWGVERRNRSHPSIPSFHHWCIRSSSTWGSCCHAQSLVPFSLCFYCPFTLTSTGWSVCWWSTPAQFQIYYCFICTWSLFLYLDHFWLPVMQQLVLLGFTPD